MSPTIDYSLVILAVLAAGIYLLWRRAKSRRKLDRDWASGRAENCGSCPVIEIRKQQRTTAKKA
jgi:hypothetical protein